MMEAAAQATASAYQELLKLEPRAAKPALIAVTILTSMTAETLSEELNVSLPLGENGALFSQARPAEQA
jgi:orotidine-5'-phosphate decarboxylase